MVFEIFLVVFFSAIAVWLTWTFTARAYENKLASYTKIINEFEGKSKELERQLGYAKQQVEATGNAPKKAAELEIRAKDLQEKYMRVITALSTVKDRVQKEYAGHSVTTMIVGEIEKVLPTKETLQKQKAVEAKDVFNRIKERLGDGKKSAR